MKNSNHHTNKVNLANLILKELISTTNTHHEQWIRKCNNSNEIETEIKYSKKSELCPESEIYFKTNVVEDLCCPYWQRPGEIELVIGISNDCAKHSLKRKGVQRIHKKPYSLELDEILSSQNFKVILDRYDFKPSSFDYIDRSDEEKITYVGVFENKKVSEILKI